MPGSRSCLAVLAFALVAACGGGGPGARVEATGATPEPPSDVAPEPPQDLPGEPPPDVAQEPPTDDTPEPPQVVTLAAELVRLVLPDGETPGDPPSVLGTGRLEVSTGTGRTSLRPHLDSRIPRPAFFTPFNRGFEVGTTFADAVSGETASGSGRAFVVLLDGRRLELGHERLSETVLPASGTARYAGSYMGLVSLVGSKTYLGYITGEVTLDADFAGMTIGGEITNRASTNFELPAFAPMTLLPGPIDGATGRFGAETSGGRLLSADPRSGPAAGTYSGLLVGAAGAEAVGNLSVLHDFDGTPAIRESGAFVAD